MKHKKRYKYDFVLSFAGEDRELVESVKEHLKQNNFSVFYDFDETEILLGKDLTEYFSTLYQKDGRFCVMFISKYYINKPWTKWERRSALARAFKSKKEYIIPYFLDNSKLPSIPETIGRAKFPDTSPEKFAMLLIKKCYKEEDALEIIDGVFIKNVEEGKSLTTQKRLCGAACEVLFNFSIANATDNDLKINTGRCYLNISNEYLQSPMYLLLPEPENEAEGLGWDWIVKPHSVRGFACELCSFSWIICTETDKLRLVLKSGPTNVLSTFPKKVECPSDDIAEGISKDILKSLSKNNFEIFNNVNVEICMDFWIQSRNKIVSIETIIYENRARFSNIKEIRSPFK